MDNDLKEGDGENASFSAEIDTTRFDLTNVNPVDLGKTSFYLRAPDSPAPINFYHRELVINFVVETPSGHAKQSERDERGPKLGKIEMMFELIEAE